MYHQENPSNKLKRDRPLCFILNRKGKWKPKQIKLYLNKWYYRLQKVITLDLRMSGYIWDEGRVDWKMVELYR